MLELLVKYAETHLDTEPGFKKERIRWAIMFDVYGKFLDVVPLDDEKEAAMPGMDFPKCPKIDSNVMRSGGKSHFLVETAGVVVLLGEDSTEKKPKHDYFVGLLNQASTVMPVLTKIGELLYDDKTLNTIRARLLSQKAKANDLVTLQVGSAYLVDSDILRDWWRKLRSTSFESESKPKPKRKKSMSVQRMRCFATGELVEPQETHPPIRGLRNVGGNAETTLIGFDKDSFCSYRLSQSANAAVSEAEAFAYRDALNDLIENHSQGLAGAKVVHWFKKSVTRDDDPLAWLEVDEEQQERSAQQRAKELLEGIRIGKRVDILDNYFYAMTLSGSGGRVMVRDWMEGQFENLVTNISAWFDHLEITNLSGRRSAKSPGIERVITCLLPERKPSQNYDNWIKPIGTGRAILWKAAIINETIPYTALSRAVLQHRAFLLSGQLEEILDEKNSRNTANSRSLLYARMGLMKAYQIRKDRDGGKEIMSVNLSPYLNEDHPHPAYHCGRLIATLAELQRSALGDVGAGVIQRYYASASSTPALVLGRLTRTSQFHLGKLSPGLTYWYEGQIASIWGRIKDCIPPILTLEEQSLFALGFYQQLAHLRAGSPDKSNEMKESNNE